MAQAKLKVSSRLLKKRVVKKRTFGQARQCRFTSNPELAAQIDYKNVDFLKHFLTQRGKILPSRVSGNSAYYQRLVAQHIKLARSMALLPYCLIQAD
jgi:small subunit ribosomal protein S18